MCTIEGGFLEPRWQITLLANGSKLRSVSRSARFPKRTDVAKDSRSVSHSLAHWILTRLREQLRPAISIADGKVINVAVLVVGCVLASASYQPWVMASSDVSTQRQNEIVGGKLLRILSGIKSSRALLKAILRVWSDNYVYKDRAAMFQASPHEELNPKTDQNIRMRILVAMIVSCAPHMFPLVCCQIGVNQ